MKEIEYELDETKFAKLVKDWYTQKPAWKALNLLHWLFLLLGVAAIVVMSIEAVQPTVPDMEAAVLLVVAGVVLAVIPFCLAYVTKSQAIRRVGKPYSAMMQVFLYSNDTGIQFGYHDRYDPKWIRSAIVHQIAYANIHHVELDRAQKLLTVVGRTERVEYRDYTENIVEYRFTNGQFGDMAEFSFFLSLENDRDFLDVLRAHDVEIRVV